MAHWRGISAAIVAAVLALGTYGVVLGSRSPAAAGASAAEGYVRTNQVGYPLSADKRAYLMASVPAPRARFTVTDDGGRVVAAGRVGPDLGRWSRRFPHVYPIDFTRVRRAGTFALSVAGPAQARAMVRVGAGAALYAGPIRNALGFYRVQRDGAAIVRSALRTAPSHLNDADAMTYRTPKVDGDGAFKGDLAPLGVRIDASGGWWDAGDYLKFVHATAYTDAVLLMGVRDFPGQMGSGAGPADFDAEARFGARWLMRMWDDRTRTLYYQVGIGNGNDAIVSDHDIWRLPQDDDTYGGRDPAYRYIRHRPVFRAGPPGSPVSPNLAGRDAAALALCYQVYRTSDPGFARNCLASAEHLFDLADTTPDGHLTTAIPFDFYPESEWRDDLELGAAELALALEQPGAPRGLPHRDPRHYVELAAHWAHAYIHGPNDAADTLNLYDVSALGHGELIRAMARARARPRRYSRGPARRPAPAAGPGDRPGKDRRIRVRLRVGPVRHDDSRHGPRRHCEPVRRAHALAPVRRARHALARKRARGQRVGVVVHRRRRAGVPALHAAPGRQHRRLARRNGSRPGRCLRRGPELRGHERQAPAHAGLPRGRRRFLRPLQLECGLPRQRGVLLDRRARDRPHGDEPARLRPRRGRQVLRPAAPRAPRSGDAPSGCRRDPRSLPSRLRHPSGRRC